jgi:hypothetical protein
MGGKLSPKHRFDFREGAKNLATIELLVRTSTLDKN